MIGFGDAKGKDKVAAAMRTAERVARQEQAEEARAAFDVGYERGFHAGWEAAEREARARRDAAAGLPEETPNA